MFSIKAKRQQCEPATNAVAFFDWHWLGRHRIVTALVLGICAAIAATQSGLAFRTDEKFRTVREAWLDRPASGQIHILEIDSKSIDALDSWPWKRSIHGDIVDKLSQAGAETIAFDVDFSSPSSAAEDSAFGEAIARSEATVILPTFVQKTTTQGMEISENLPIDVLRDNAFLASVNVYADRDGSIRSMEYGTVTEGMARPTMAAVLANASGDIGENFRIDTSIDPSTLPRHSVIDLLSDKLPQGALTGKSVFIGATAIELGDRYPMIGHGVQPGVVIQALAAETLMHRQAFITLDYSISLVIALIVAAAMLRCRRLRIATTTAATGITILLATPLALEFLEIGTIDIASAFYSIVAAGAILVTARILGKFNYIRLVDAETGLPNERSMILDLAAKPNHVIVMEIQNFSEFAAILDDRTRLSLLTSITTTLAIGSDGANIHRLGQNRFGWLSSSQHVTLLTEAIEGLQAILTSRVVAETNNVLINASFGIAAVTRTDSSADINNAGLAARQAAITGTRWTVFTEDMGDRNGYIQQVLTGLDDALASDDIYLLLQPKWSIRHQQVVGAEALVRWNHGTLGPISPAEFIPVLEQHNQMATLTLEIARRCGWIASSWHKEGRDVSVALNISAPLLCDFKFTTALTQEMQSLGPAKRQITFEVTESAAVTDEKALVTALEGFRAMGLKISIDDYGTGQSTLSYLQKLPADEIKIDQSFVRNILTNKSDQILVRSTIELGHELGLVVVAEGVEDEATMALLASYKCDVIQGWHIGRPMPLDKITAMIATTDISTKRMSA